MDMWAPSQALRSGLSLHRALGSVGYSGVLVPELPLWLLLTQSESWTSKIDHRHVDDLNPSGGAPWGWMELIYLFLFISCLIPPKKDSWQLTEVFMYNWRFPAPNNQEMGEIRAKRK